jgi:multiple sugar transport system substrate-binding protein
LKEGYKMKKVFLWLLIISMIATFTLVSCEKEGAAEEAEEAEEEVVAEKEEAEEEEMPAETITFWAMPNAPAEPHLAWMEEAAADFKEQTNITVEFEEVGWGDVVSKVSTACVTPICDVSQVGTTQNPQFAATGGLLELDIDEFGGADSFLAANLESCTLDGDFYGVPWFAETRVLFINKDMFEQAGATVPTTWDELMVAGEKIVAEYGEGKAISMAGTNAWDLIHNFAALLWANNGNILNEDNTAAAFNSPEGVEAMTFYIRWLAEGLADPSCAEYNQPQADAAFIAGNVAMVVMGPWNISGILDENPDLNFEVVELPKSPTGGKGAFSGGSNLVIFTESEHKEAAKKWVNYLTSDDVLISYNQPDIANMIPAKLSTLEDPYYQSPEMQTFITTLGYATAYPPLAVWVDIENAIKGEFSNILTAYVEKAAAGPVTEEEIEAIAKEHLDSAAEKVDEALAQ